MLKGITCIFSLTFSFCLFTLVTKRFRGVFCCFGSARFIDIFYDIIFNKPVDWLNYFDDRRLISSPCAAPVYSTLWDWHPLVRIQNCTLFLTEKKSIKLQSCRTTFIFSQTGWIQWFRFRMLNATKDHFSRFQKNYKLRMRKRHSTHKRCKHGSKAVPEGRKPVAARRETHFKVVTGSSRSARTLCSPLHFRVSDRSRTTSWRECLC